MKVTNKKNNDNNIGIINKNINKNKKQRKLMKK